jgi:anaerobic selenocysteine-containing dehydrogenase
VEVNPATAQAAGRSNGDLVRLQSSAGDLTVPVLIYPGIRPDVVAIPIGQGHRESGRYAKGRGVNPIRLLAEATDANSGDLAWAATRVKMTATGERLVPTSTGGKPDTLGRQILGPSDGEHG